MCFDVLSFVSFLSQVKHNCRGKTYLSLGRSKETEDRASLPTILSNNLEVKESAKLAVHDLAKQRCYPCLRKLFLLP